MCQFDGYRETILNIDSSKRSSTQRSSTNFQVNLNTPHMVRGIKLESFHIPYTWYNITSSNGSFSMNYSSTTYDMSIQGRYTNMVSLLADIKYQLDNCGAGLTFTLFQTNNGKITISAGSNFELIFSSNNIWDIIGFDSVQTLTGQSSYTSSKVPKFYSLDKYLKLRIEFLNGNIEHVDGLLDSTTFIIQVPNPFDLNFGDIVALQNENDYKNIRFDSPIRLKTFKISVHNQDNELIELNNNDWYACVRLFEE